MTRLADTSAWIVSRRTPALAHAFAADLKASAVATCDMVTFELLSTTRNAFESRLRRAQLDLLTRCPIGESQWRRALDVYEELARQGGAHHRSVGHQDLLIAAAAESASVPVLHYDSDFDRIAAVTGQETVWIAPRGSL